MSTCFCFCSILLTQHSESMDVTVSARRCNVEVGIIHLWKDASCGVVSVGSSPIAQRKPGCILANSVVCCLRSGPQGFVACIVGSPQPPFAVLRHRLFRAIHIVAVLYCDFLDRSSGLGCSSKRRWQSQKDKLSI
ncbi:hypothetical protein FB567DRAFT_540916 [Paraphoma chrysanthemicola]|uniref:Secreted protein n=1 Tax=Paraphoma chrysanthemicola TaxID=798071 RepID=A0A8K0VRT3_9PLEO|nr:hypothetical protein FB567DRAFT_540916 [Paraphoma chrysanthemicola]